MSREVDLPADPSFTVTQDENPLLWALQQYQKIIRHWMGDLTAIEFTVLMQIIDRTVGWQKRQYTIGIPNLLNGGRHYVGIGNAVKKSALLNALRSLENRGIIERRRSPVHSQMKEYWVNLDWQPSVPLVADFRSSGQLFHKVADRRFAKSRTAGAVWS